MNGSQHTRRRVLSLLGTGLLATVGLWTLTSADAVYAATVLNGPLNLGTASTYGVLAGSAITNTGPTVVNGDLGISPGSAITGFTGAPNGSNIGAVNNDNAAAGQAKNDLTTAYNDAASLTPTLSGLSELSGMSLTPGVYSGGALSLANNGILTLAGTSANSVWVFQAASALTIGSATQIVITGGATACNVFWQVGSSATIGTSAQFQGTVMASQSISANTGAAIQGRLLASTSAVTLQSNTITVPTNCAAGTSPTTSPSPAITSGAPTAATAGTPYSFTVTSTGLPGATYTVGYGTLPAGLQINATTGVISGTPTGTGSSTFRVTASNGIQPDVGAIYTLSVLPAFAAAATVSSAVTPALPVTGVNVQTPLLLAGSLLSLGLVVLLVEQRRRRRSPEIV